MSAAGAVIYVLAMSHRLRKFIGTMGMVIFTIAYIWLAVSIALARLPGTGIWTQIGFYFVVSLIWFAVCAAVIWWMRPRPADGSGITHPVD